MIRGIKSSYFPIVLMHCAVTEFQKLFLQGFGGNLSEAYLKANTIAGEAVSNIRTLAAFCSEEKVLNLYSQELVEPSKRSFTRGQIAGLSYGVCQFFIYSSYGLALWYRKFQLHNLFLNLDFFFFFCFCNHLYFMLLI